MVTILIVDDEQVEREGVGYLINRRNLPIVTKQAQNGQAALDVLQKEPIDILITDVKMPIMNGMELCRRVRLINNELVILVLSAYGDFEYTQKAIQARVDDYILKPVDIKEFDTALDSALNIVEQRQHQNVQDNESIGVSEYRREKQFAESLENDPNSSDKNKQDTHVVNEVLHLVDEYYNQNIGLEWIAERVCLSAGYLSGLFKRSFGKGFTQYLTEYRMKKARQYLIQTNIKIVDICEMVGYTNTSYFCLQFKKFYGITAIQMREKGGKG
jgi:two-component system response regulator YesN